MPPSTVLTPKSNRRTPVIWSMPTVDSSSPMSAAISPLIWLREVTAEMQLRPRTPSAKYSEGPNSSATEASTGVTVNSAAVANSPPIADEAMAMPSATPASPRAVK